MTQATGELTTRPLLESDFARVVDIDAAVTGRKRPGFFEKRLQAALTEPKHFIYLGCEREGELCGFLMARLLEGEYGQMQPVAVLDVIDVDPAVQGRGVGRRLMQDFDAILQHKQIHEKQSQADWRNQDMLRFFSGTGFRLAPRHMLERQVTYMETGADEEEEAETGANIEIDFSDPAGDQAGSLARDRVVCRSLEEGDLDALVRIDSRVTGLARRAYYERKVREVLEESGIRVSLVAEIKGTVAGFIMVRVDYGEFDRTEPVAVLDTIAVDPDLAHHYVGTALLAQLLGNLATLRLETIRTEVRAEQFDVTAFLMHNRFYPAQRLSFSCELPSQ